MPEPLLEVHDLTVRYHSSSLAALDNVSFSLSGGESLGLIGQSGSGKTTLARTLLWPRSRHYEIISGSIKFRGIDLLCSNERELRRVRGRELSSIPQEPELALNPVLPIGDQIVEVLRAHAKGSVRSFRERALSMLESVGLGIPGIDRCYSHQLSGGQRQRVVIAQALVCKPSLLIADEPTSALDENTEQEIVELLKRLKEQFGLSLIFITHKPDLLTGLTERVAVMSRGRLTEQLTSAPARNPATAFRTCTRWRPDREPFTAEKGKPLVEVCALSKSYRRGGRLARNQTGVAALSEVSLTILRGKTLALVGESGSGKSTLAKCIARLEEPDSGEIRLDGRNTVNLSNQELAVVRRRIQLVFQHSATAMNPRYSMEDVLDEPLRIAGNGTKEERRATVHSLMTQVGVTPQWGGRRPSEFSGGQRQRLAIARALILKPDLLIFDEALAGLDLTTRMQIAEMLIRLQECRQTSYLFITHDREMANYLADSIVVIERGKIVRSGAQAAWFSPPDSLKSPNRLPSGV